MAVFALLYGVVLESQKLRLQETSMAQARMIEAIAADIRGATPPGLDWRQPAIMAVNDALRRFPGFGESGEFTFGAREGDQIVFYLRHRHADFDRLLPVPWDSGKAAPMRRALEGLSGVDVLIDYRGAEVLAAYEPVAVLGMGLVAKIDMAEIRRPFLIAAMVAVAIALVVVTLGAVMFIRVTQPMVERIASSERRHRALFSQMAEAVAVLRPNEAGEDFIYVDVNPAALRMEGMEAGDFIGHTLTEVFPGAMSHGLLDMARRVLITGNAETLAMAFYQDDRISGWRDHAIYRLPTGEVVHLWDEVTDKKRAETGLQMAASVFNHTGEGIIVTTPDGLIERVNPAFTTITGYASDEVIGRPPSLLSSDRQGPGFYQAMWQALRDLGRWQGELWNRRKNGEAYLEWLTISEVRDEMGRVAHYVGVFDDISELHEKEQRIRHQAFHDALTGLPNRALLLDRLDHAIAASRRGDHKTAVLFLDLDRFKIVNDSLGHDVGDELLKEVAVRLKSSLRQADTVARLGGDEFVVLSTEWVIPSDVATLAEKIQSLLEKPFHVAGHELHIGVSAGIALHPVDGANAGELLKNADTAMYAVKESGRNGYRFFSADLNEAAVERLTLEVALRRAIESGELEVHYQPKFVLATGAMAGAEALVRWRHPELGMIAPIRFIPLAEETGLVVPLGEWVLRRVCRQVAAWRRVGYVHGPIAVNVSARQLALPDFASRVATILGEEGVDPDAIDLEITETAIMREPERAAAMLTSLAVFGTKVVLDDFGVGYSSLGYLKRLPISVLKMDRSFINDVTEDTDAAALACGIVQLARHLDIEVVAEGVETEAQADFLRSSGCALVQGYLFARPMPPEDMEIRFMVGMVAQ